MGWSAPRSGHRDAVAGPRLPPARGLQRRTHHLSGPDLTAYADLIASTGVRVVEGQDVVVYAQVEHAPLVRAIAEAAYRRGARHVTALYSDQLVRRALVELGPPGADDLGSPWQAALIDSLGEKGGALVWVGGNAHPGWNEGIAPERARRMRRDSTRAALMRRIDAGDVNWTSVCAPTPGWARLVLGEPDVARLWDELSAALRLDRPDPAREWKERGAELDRRAAELNALRIRSLRVVGPGTDLHVGLLEASLWRSALLRTSDGREHLANLPTEEVFTMPDPRATEGTLRITRPVVLPGGGKLFRRVDLRFESGLLVSSSPDDFLDVVAVDEGARRLGELALVDGGSPVGARGLVFYETLLDENASSHVALGQSYAATVADGSSNDSAAHVDVSFGGPGVSVVATCAGGRAVTLLEADEWQLE